MAKSSHSPESAKPSRPKDFPLSIHKGTGRWCKKVCGRVVYFGKVADDPKGERAVNLWLDQKDDLRAGRTPRAKDESFRLIDICNHFLTYKLELVGSGELSKRTYDGYKDVCEQLVGIVGKYRSASDVGPKIFQKFVQVSRRSTARSV